jgi:hypothetical protein
MTKLIMRRIIFPKSSTTQKTTHSSASISQYCPAGLADLTELGAAAPLDAKIPARDLPACLLLPKVDGRVLSFVRQSGTYCTPKWSSVPLLGLGLSETAPGQRIGWPIKVILDEPRSSEAPSHDAEASLRKCQCNLGQDAVDRANHCVARQNAISIQFTTLSRSRSRSISGVIIGCLLPSLAALLDGARPCAPTCLFVANAFSNSGLGTVVSNLYKHCSLHDPASDSPRRSLHRCLGRCEWSGYGFLPA